MGREPAKISKDLRPIGFFYTGKYAQAETNKENRMNIYVGNLSQDVTEEDLMQAFGEFGRVESAKLIKDKFSGEPRGFGFVGMPSDKEARAAIDGLNGKDLKGRSINVNEARPQMRDDRGRGTRGSFGRGGGRGGSRGGGSRGSSRGNSRGGGRGRY